MTETGFGPGGYASTVAVTPSSPILAVQSSTSVLISLGSDTNPATTEYAVHIDTIGEFVDASGGGSVVPVWQTSSEWGMTAVSGLSPSTAYMFEVKARNPENTETAYGPSAQITTYGAASEELAVTLIVRKASSTISAPSFMSNLPASISLAGKNLNDFGLYVDTISGLDLPKIMPDEELVPGDHTWQIWDEYFAPKRIVMEGVVHGASPDDLRIRLAYLKSFLATFEGNPWRSTAPIRLERSDLTDRHWNTYYESIDALETLGKRDLSSSARIRVTMKCPMPYAISNEVFRVVYTPVAGSFTALELGNAPSDAVFVVKGASVNPSFTLGDMIFHSDFSDGLAFTDVEKTAGTGTFAPSGNEAAAYRTTETGMGMLVTNTDTISYTADGNPADGSWVVVISPQWHSTSQGSDVVVLEHKGDADNYIRLYWDASEDTWVFRKMADGTLYEVSSTAQAFTADTRIIIGCAYDSTNAGGMKLYIDGVQAGVNGNTDVLDTSPGTVTLNEGSGSLQPDAVFDMIAGWSRMLSADEMMKIATDTTAVVNLNTTFTYTGTLDTGDLLTLNSYRKTAELFDVSAGTRANALGSAGGEIPVLTPGRRRTASDRTQTMIYTKVAASEMEVRYTRRYL